MRVFSLRFPDAAYSILLVQGPAVLLFQSQSTLLIGRAEQLVEGEGLQIAECGSRRGGA